MPIKWLFVNIGSVKPIKYTRHAKNRMRWHKITEIEVELALKAPEFLEPSGGEQIECMDEEFR